MKMLLQKLALPLVAVIALACAPQAQARSWHHHRVYVGGYYGYGYPYYSTYYSPYYGYYSPYYYGPGVSIAFGGGGYYHHHYGHHHR